MSIPLPPYTFIPGHWPHPCCTPGGHSYGLEPVPAAPLALETWTECGAYLHGIVLFNAGYYWEAHELWEEVWKALGRRGIMAELLKGLIKLGAVGIKIRQGRPKAAQSLLRRSREHFESVALNHSDEVAGLNLTQLIAWATLFSETVPALQADPTLPVEVILPPLPGAASTIDPAKSAT